MGIIATAASAVLAAEHAYILVLEMFLWTHPRGRRAFGLKPEFAEQTKALAANQGLYNGFLAAGLAWSIAHPEAQVARQLQLFFNGCVFVAGLYGGSTAHRKIFFVQAAPGAVALAATLLGL